MHRLPCIFNDLQACIVGPHGSVGRSHLRTVSGVHNLGISTLPVSRFVLISFPSVGFKKAHKSFGLRTTIL